MGELDPQPLLFLHPVNIILNHRGNQIFHVPYKVVVDVSTVLPKVYIPHNSFFPTIFKCATKIKKIIYFVIFSCFYLKKLFAFKEKSFQNS